MELYALSISLRSTYSISLSSAGVYLLYEHKCMVKVNIYFRLLPTWTFELNMVRLRAHATVSFEKQRAQT